MTLHVATWAVAIVPLLWLYLIFGRGAFWRVTLTRVQIKGQRKSIVAIVPARNEAEVIERALSSLLNQQFVYLQIILVDDNSSDETAAIAKSLSRQNTNLTIISGKPLPPGWSGKVWAMQQGIEAAQSFSPDYLLFTDADIQHDSENVARLLSIAISGSYDLASFMVKLHCSTLPEKLLIPAFVFFFFQLYPPQWVASSNNSTAGAAGGCLLIRARALQDAGGLQQIRNEIIDDCSLARLVKRSGGTLWLGLTESAHSIRPYRSLAEIERMISRTAFNQLRHSGFLLAAAVVGLLLTYLAPVALLFGTTNLAVMSGALAFAVMMTAYAPMVRFYRLNPLWTLTLPFVAIFYMSATIHSAWKYWFGRGGQWKGREQDQPGREGSLVH
jgi:hopene-associated glycosyltransferase HpnB